MNARSILSIVMPPIVMKVLLFHQWLTLEMLYSIVSNFLITGDAMVIPIIVTILPRLPDTAISQFIIEVHNKENKQDLLTSANSAITVK